LLWRGKVPAVTKVDEAAALEAEADEYPDERGEILSEAAVAWREAGVLSGLVSCSGNS